MKSVKALFNVFTKVVYYRWTRADLVERKFLKIIQIVMSMCRRSLKADKK